MNNEIREIKYFPMIHDNKSEYFINRESDPRLTNNIYEACCFDKFEDAFHYTKGTNFSSFPLKSFRIIKMAKVIKWECA